MEGQPNETLVLITVRVPLWKREQYKDAARHGRESLNRWCVRMLDHASKTVQPWPAPTSQSTEIPHDHQP